MGKRIRVLATATATGHQAGSGWSTATAPTQPAPLVVANTERPRITGVVRVGERLRVSRGHWSPEEVIVTYQWYAGRKAIRGATHRRLRLTGKQVGQRVWATVEARAFGHTPTKVATLRTHRVRA